MVAFRTEKSVVSTVIAAGGHETGDLSMEPGVRIAPFPMCFPKEVGSNAV